LERKRAAVVTYFRTSSERDASTSDLALRSQLPGCDFVPKDVLSDLVENCILSFKAFDEQCWRTPFRLSAGRIKLHNKYRINFPETKFHIEKWN
jgi:hypothetical protein